jgi:hypothetical protein
VVLRVLTSRATQKVLLYLGETDLYMAQWLSDFVARNPPLEGDKVRLPCRVFWWDISARAELGSPSIMYACILVLR